MSLEMIKKDNIVTTYETEDGRKGTVLKNSGASHFTIEKGRDAHITVGVPGFGAAEGFDNGLKIPIEVGPKGGVR